MGDYTPPVKPDSAVTILNGLKEYASDKAKILNVTSPFPTNLSLQKEYITKAMNIAQKSDKIIVVLGGSSSRFENIQFQDNGAVSSMNNTGDFLSLTDCGEGVDIADLNLPDWQFKLLSSLKTVGKPIITIILAGRPYATDRVSKLSDALICSFYSGPAGSLALSKILFGEIAPSGRLSVSLPNASGQIPTFYNYKSSYVSRYSDKVYNNPLCEVATHSLTHSSLDSLPEAQCMSEIINDRQNLEKLFDKTICGHAYPYGAYNDNAVDILKQAGIVYARTTESHLSFKIPTDWLRMGATCHHNNSKLLELADKFINGEVGNSDGWLFYLWGHTYEFRQNGNWDIIIDFFENIAKNENVWYATNIEFYEYVTAYRNLVYSSNATKVYNPSCTDVWIKIDGNKVFVPAGKTVDI